MRLLLISLILFKAMFCLAQNQGINNIWLMGYHGGLGETRINFFSGSPLVDTIQIPMDFNHTHANISDSSGNLLFYTNGYYIADANHDTMQNGSGINPGPYANFVPEGFLIPQGALAIKKPGSDSLYYLFHCSDDNYPSTGSYSFFLYLSIINIKGNGGLGTVISKNQVLISDTLNVGKIAACKHANGRDWWIMIHRANSNTFYKFLITPYGNTFYTQIIGSYREWDAGQAKFSPDGTRYAYFHYRFKGLDIFDFDRCTGMLSNPINDSLPLEIGNVGCEFSPNSNVLYVCNITNIYQYDLTATNILASRTTVASYDGFYDQWPGLGTYLCYPQLAPDGKIYITTGNSTRYMHIINYPDSLDTLCNVVQHGLPIYHFSFNTLPNPPNYFLGPVLGSVCDSLPHVGLAEHSNQILPKAYPNPSNGKFTLQFPVQPVQGVCEVYDVNGKCVFKESVAQWSQYKRIDISDQSSGIYFCKTFWSNAFYGSIKIIKE